MTSAVRGDCLIDVTDDTPAQQRPDEGSSSLSLVAEVEAIEFDPSKKFVRITGIQQNRLIEFDFSVGEPELYIELVLPFQAFQDFCANNQVQHLNAEQAAAVDYDRLKWRSGSPGIEH